MQALNKAAVTFTKQEKINKKHTSDRSTKHTILSQRVSEQKNWKT